MTAPTLDTVNRAIEQIHPGIALALWHDTIYVTNGIIGYEAREDAPNGYFIKRSIGNSFGMGGTRERALVHMVLWAKDKRRCGLYAWRDYRTTALVRGTAQALPDYLVANGYADPEKIGCIFCGSTEGSFDWFHQPVRHAKDGSLVAVKDLPKSAWRTALTGPGHWARWCETLGHGSPNAIVKVM